MSLVHIADVLGECIPEVQATRHEPDTPEGVRAAVLELYRRGLAVHDVSRALKLHPMIVLQFVGEARL